jgi:hypothetical protein
VETSATPTLILLIFLAQLGKFGYRWWSNPSSFVLAPTNGAVTFTVPLHGSQWTDVNGMNGVQQPSGFAAALAHPANIGMTFGGGCFFGHGVFIDSGTATFNVTGFSVN